MLHPHVRYRSISLLYYYIMTFKEVQLVQTQHHCDGCAAKRTATALVVHCVGSFGTRLTETLMTDHPTQGQPFHSPPWKALCINVAGRPCLHYRRILNTNSTLKPWVRTRPGTPGRCSWASFTDRLRPFRFSIHYWYWYFRVFSSDGFSCVIAPAFSTPAIFSAPLDDEELNAQSTLVSSTQSGPVAVNSRQIRVQCSLTCRSGLRNSKDTSEKIYSTCSWVM